MKRFWKDVAVEAEDGGWGIRLDGRPVKTPARATLVVPTQMLADAIADEWNTVDGEIDPRRMPLTGLANAAIDRVGPAKEEFAAGLGRGHVQREGLAAQRCQVGEGLGAAGSGRHPRTGCAVLARELAPQSA